MVKQNYHPHQLMPRDAAGGLGGGHLPGGSGDRLIRVREECELDDRPFPYGVDAGCGCGGGARYHGGRPAGFHAAASGANGAR